MNQKLKIKSFVNKWTFSGILSLCLRALHGLPMNQSVAGS